MPPKVSFLEPDCTCPSGDRDRTPTPTPTSCHRHHPPNMDEIVPGLFLGNLTAAESPEFLTKHAITHVLSITSSCPLVPTGYVHKYHNLHDDHGADLLGVLPDCVDRLGYLLSESGGEAGGKRVLVHCCMGKSRSGAVVVAYVMKAHRCTLDTALAHVVSKRAIVRPNSGFMRQLRAWGGSGCSPWVREELAAVVVRPRVVGRAGSRRRRSVFDEEWVVVGEVGEECVGVNGWGEVGGGGGGLAGAVEVVRGVLFGEGVGVGVRGGGVGGVFS